MQLFQRHAENDQETGRAKFFEKSVVDLWKVRMFEFCGINIAKFSVINFANAVAKTLCFWCKLLNANLSMSNFSAESFIFKYFYDWFNTLPSESAFISQYIFCGYQVNLENTTNINSSL